MTKPSPSAFPRTRRPMISQTEVAELARRHGTPVQRTFNVQADEYIRTYRWRKDSDRRAEVVFAIQDVEERIWLHAKPHYPAHIFRLPSGGIHWHESVKNALLREVEEETGLSVTIERFIGLIEYHFHNRNSTVKFASYVFHLLSDGGVPQPHAGENISAFHAILPNQVAQTAADLRNLIGDRRGWGQWRALAHDLVYEHLTG